MEISNAPGNGHADEMKVPDLSRRRFFQLAGGIAGAGLLLEACRKTSPPTTVFMGSGDVALLNLYYIIQQLEAAFYAQAVATPYYGLDVKESQALTDLRDQEIAHMQYIKSLLGQKAVMNISPNFSAVTFADRSSVLDHAATIEELSIAAITGSVRLYTNTDYVFALSKMLSVEGRHAAYARDLLSHNSFANSTVVDTYGLDVTGTPSSVLTKAQAYIHTTFDSSKLPN